MDELTPEELRGAANAANLRRAFGAPVEGEPPAAFRALLSRIASLRPEATGQAGRQGARHGGARLGS